MIFHGPPFLRYSKKTASKLLSKGSLEYTVAEIFRFPLENLKLFESIKSA